MRTKSFGLFALSILAMVLVAGLSSAAITLAPTTYSANVAQGKSNSFTFTMFNNGGTGNQAVKNITVVSSNLVSGSNTLQSSQVTVTNVPSTVAPNATSSAITVTVNVPSSQSLGTYTGTLTVDGLHNDTNSSIGAKTISLSFNVVKSTDIPSEVTDCTARGNPGNIEVRNIDFTNNGIVSAHIEFGSDDEWFPLENIDAKVDVRNRGNNNKDRVNNIEVDWGVWDTDKNQWVIEPIDEKNFDLKDGKTDTVSVSFTVDEKDLDVNLDELTDGDNYLFYAIATGEVDDGNDTSTCSFDSKKASVVLESDFVVLDNLQMPETAQCGATVDVSADVWNIGDNDQDSVSVYATNKDLSLVNNVDAGDINAFDKQKISFSFKVPSDAEEKVYPVKFQIYDDNSDVYKNDFNDDLSEFSLPLSVSGGCTGGTGAVLVSANIVSGGKAGQPLVVKATVTNTGNSQKVYTLNAAGFEDWASSFSLDQNTLALNAGQSKDVSVTLNVNDNAAGSRTFFLELLSGGELVRQPVTVSVLESGGAGITGFVTGGKWYLWGIGLLNVLLVVVIIVVAVRIARKK